MRRSTSSSVSTEQSVSAKTKEVLHLLTRRGPSLTPKQQEYCSEACINRILGTRHHSNVKKAAKQLRATLTWRANFDVDYLTADEFSAELATGLAYVAGHDEQHRPVLIVTIRPESTTNEAKKKLLRFFAFTLEVAIATMEAPVEQCVLIIHAGSLRKGSRAISTIFQLLKLFSDHYQRRLARAFILDAPFMLYYVWKGLGPLLDLGINEQLRFVYTTNYTSTQAIAVATSHHTRAAKSSGIDEHDGDPFVKKPNKHIQSCYKVCTTNPSDTNDASLLSDKSKARSLSFTASWIKPYITSKETATEFRSFRIQSSQQQRRAEEEQAVSQRLHHLSFIDEAKEDCDSIHKGHQSKHEKTKQKALDLFAPYYVAFVKGQPYNEATYRAKLKPPLAGLISIVSSDLSCIKQQRHEATTGLHCLELEPGNRRLHL